MEENLKSFFASNAKDCSWAFLNAFLQYAQNPGTELTLKENLHKALQSDKMLINALKPNIKKFFEAR